MRIIAGSRGGLKLFSVKGNSTRPTLDRVKEAVMSMLDPYINGAEVLDLFAGTGGIALELLSRGAKNAVLIEKMSASCEVIKLNIEKARFEAETELRKQDALDYIRMSNKSFDIIYLDPPYVFKQTTDLINKIAQQGLIKPSGIIVLEREVDKSTLRPSEIPEPTGFTLLKDKQYGRIKIEFYKRSVDEGSTVSWEL